MRGVHQTLIGDSQPTKDGQALRSAPDHLERNLLERDMSFPSGGEFHSREISQKPKIVVQPGAVSRRGATRLMAATVRRERRRDDRAATFRGEDSSRQLGSLWCLHLDSQRHPGERGQHLADSGEVRLEARKT